MNGNRSPLVKFLVGICLVWGWLGKPEFVQAHPISITDAYVLVYDDRLEVRLEVFVEDLYLFHRLPLTEESALPADAVERGTKIHEEFLKQRFKILTADGQRLQPRTRKINREDVPTEDIPFPNLMNYKIYYEFTYPLAEPVQYLTFIQDLTHESSFLPSEVEVKLKPPRGRRFQQLLLPNQPWTVDLLEAGSADAPDDQDLTPAERFEKMRQEKLGITSYGATYAFFYLDKHEVRLETLIPLATLALSLDLDLQADGQLGLAQQEALRNPISELFRQKVLVTGPAGPLSPILRRIDYYGVTFRDFNLQEDPRSISIANARVGIIVSYPRLADQNSGTLEWDLFNPFLQQVNLAVIASTGAETVTLRPVENGHIYPWEASPDSEGELTADAAHSQRSHVELLAVDVPSVWPIREFLLFGFFAALFLLLLWRKLSARSAERSASAGWYPRVLLSSALLLVSLLLLFEFTTWGVPRSRLLNEEQQTEVAEALLDQIYSAFNQRNEEAIFDHLEGVVDGPLLRDLYLEIRRSMTIEEQGGALARAGRVTLLECLSLESAGQSNEERFAERLTCRWLVPGTVEHWGHIHRRTTEYLADITLAPRSVPETPLDSTELNSRDSPPTATQTTRKQWKLVAVELRNQDQSILETTVRQF